MAKRPPRYAVPTVEQPAITPGTSVTMSLTQVLLVGGAILFFGTTVGTMLWTTTSTRNDVMEIKDSQKVLAKTTAEAIKDQDDKRTKVVIEQNENRQKMAADFLASNKAIADKVGELNTLLAVSQAHQKATYEKLSEQLNTLSPKRR